MACNELVGWEKRITLPNIFSLEFVGLHEPLLHGNGLNLPDAKQFFTEFTVPAPKQPKVQVFAPEIDDLYQGLRPTSSASWNKGREKAAFIADATRIRKTV